MTIALIALSFCTLYAYWAFNFWVPAYLSLPVEQRGVGLDTGEVAGLLVAMNVGGWFGYVLYGYVSDRIGRRRSFVAYLIVAAVLVFAYGRARSALVLLLLGPVVAFFSTGYFSGFGAIDRRAVSDERSGPRPAASSSTSAASAARSRRCSSRRSRSAAGSASRSPPRPRRSLLGALTWFWIPETRGERFSRHVRSLRRFV